MLMQRTISQFLTSAAPLAVALAAGGLIAGPALADTTISTGTSGALVTSAAGNVTIASTGTLTASPGAVVTVDSSSSVSVNSGGTVYAGTASSPVDGAIGILVRPGATTTVTNSGAISVLENFTPDSIKGGVVLGTVSGVKNRFGIYGAAGGTINGSITISAAPSSGTVTTPGTITVAGQNSAGIQIDSTLNGSLNTQGTIAVLGDNSYGVKLADVTGKVTLGGTTTVSGSAAQGYVQAGNVTGQVLIDGAITNTTGYTSSSGVALTIDPLRLNTSSAVVEVDGNVGGGILLNAPSSSTATDTNRGTITAYGNNPALQIGGSRAITIGSGTTNNGAYALGIDGSVTAGAGNTGVSGGTPTYAVVIGGRGGTVNLTNGLEVYGTVSATTDGNAATAILINSGATVGTIFNTGTIKAASSGISSGNLTGIKDLSGTVTAVTNQGYISAQANSRQVSAAIDLSANTTGVTLTQSYTATNLANETTDKAASTYTPATATLYAGISGDILLGTGNNTITVSGGSIAGTTTFGNGSSNSIALSGVTKWGGDVDFGSGGRQTVTLADNVQMTGTLLLRNDAGSLTLNNSAQFLGAITGGANFNVAVNGGTFGANAATTSTVGALNVASGAALRVYIDGATGTASKLVATSATFASGAKLSLAVNSLSNIAQTTPYTVLTAATLTGASTLNTSSLNLPVLFNGAVTADANNVYLAITRATPAQLGLTAAQTAAYTAILNNAASNTNIQSSLLAIYDTPTLRGQFNQLLPDYAGGNFDVVTRAARIADKHFDNDSTLFSISDSAAWLEPIIFRGTRTYGATPGFKSSGGGVSLGYEKVTGLGNIGVSLAILSGTAKTGTYQSVKTSELALGLFWRKSAGPFYIWAGGNIAKETFKSTRTFSGQYTTAATTSASATTTNVANSAAGKWKGWSAAFNGGVSYTVPLGEHFSLRPRAVLEYDRLKENGYSETGDKPIILTVLGRTSSQTTATGTLTAAWSAGPSSHEGRPFTVELEGGRRTWLSGNLGTTSASFATGDAFSITGDHLPSAWVGGLNILQGGLDYTWRVGVDAERGADKGVAYGVRASLSIAL